VDKALNENILVTVLLPVYNSEMFLREAIDSILSQSFKDFEFLIINDGSSDNSLNIINSYHDQRIKLIDNIQNKGLIFSLNKGIDLAKGKYIARMDADDISLPERLETQINYFQKYPNAEVICSPIITITESGGLTKNWEADNNIRTVEEIKKNLPKENCIAHPSVMIKTITAKKYKYNFTQKGSEDWDLWLRLISDKLQIIKTNETLLKYRYVSSGVTRSEVKKQVVELKVIKVRYNFLIQQLFKFKISIVELRVFYALFRSIARHLKVNILRNSLKKTKRIITLNPITTFQKYKKLKEFCNKQSQIDIFFFFPYCHIGGAEKVHANIVEVFEDKKVVVFFTGISPKDGFLYLFEKSAPSINVGFCLNYPILDNKSKNIIFDLIDKQNKTVVFGCNNLFFYDHILSLKNNVRVFDLMHDFRFEDEDNITHQFAEQFYRCEKRVFISSKAIEQTKKFYDFKSASLKEYDKLTLITNYVDIPAEIPKKNYNSTLKVLYVGRGTEEKRTHLVGYIAQKCSEIDSSIHFTAVGDLNNSITEKYQKYVTLTGPIFDFDKLKEYYYDFHIIIVPSEREGFPMVIMEGMAQGLCAISTPVGDVPLHINNLNGFVTSDLDENKVVEEMTNYICMLNIDREQLKNLSMNSYEYAKQNFSKQIFQSEYRSIINL